MKLIVGLGNPGKEYEKTRHNIGFMAIDRVADYFNTSFNKTKFSGEYAEFNYKNDKVILLKPGKYMNLSGEVVRDFVKFFKINIEDILIICDDLDTQVGTYRVRYKGYSGGHNGLKNIELHLGTKEYKRVKIGISNNKLMDTKDYVLGKFSSDDMNLLNPILDISPKIVEDFMELSFDRLMNKYNTKEWRIYVFI